MSTATREACSDVRAWQERIRLLREKANRHDQISRALHASADQIEEEEMKQREPALQEVV